MCGGGGVVVWWHREPFLVKDKSVDKKIGPAAPVRLDLALGKGGRQGDPQYPHTCPCLFFVPLISSTHRGLSGALSHRSLDLPCSLSLSLGCPAIVSETLAG